MFKKFMTLCLTMAVILTCFCIPVSVFAETTVVLEDDFSSLNASLMADYSNVRWQNRTESQTGPSYGDAKTLTVTDAAKEAYIAYKTGDANTIVVTTYRSIETNLFPTIYASPTYYGPYTEITSTNTLIDDSYKWWEKYAQSADIPAGTYYIKLAFPVGGNQFAIGDVTLQKEDKGVYQSVLADEFTNWDLSRMEQSLISNIRHANTTATCSKEDGHRLTKVNANVDKIATVGYQVSGLNTLLLTSVQAEAYKDYVLTVYEAASLDGPWTEVTSNDHKQIFYDSASTWYNYLTTVTGFSATTKYVKIVIPVTGNENGIWLGSARLISGGTKVSKSASATSTNLYGSKNIDTLANSNRMSSYNNIRFPNRDPENIGHTQPVYGDITTMCNMSNNTNDGFVEYDVSGISRITVKYYKGPDCQLDPAGYYNTSSDETFTELNESIKLTNSGNASLWCGYEYTADLPEGVSKFKLVIPGHEGNNVIQIGEVRFYQPLESNVTVTGSESNGAFLSEYDIKLEAETNRENITAVEFYNGGSKLADAVKDSVTGKWTYVWSEAPTGLYNITAVATYTNGKLQLTAPVSFAVSSAGYLTSVSAYYGDCLPVADFSLVPNSAVTFEVKGTVTGEVTCEGATVNTANGMGNLNFEISGMTPNTAYTVKVDGNEIFRFKTVATKQEVTNIYYENLNVSQIIDAQGVIELKNNTGIECKSYAIIALYEENSMKYISMCEVVSSPSDLEQKIYTGLLLPYDVVSEVASNYNNYSLKLFSWNNTTDIMPLANCLPGVFAE